MRNPERIEHILATLRRVWDQEPDLRLGQLVVIAAKPQLPCPEVFHANDEVLLQGLLDYERQRSSRE
jgi:uncharacterized protein YihD (DUF1040 family)